MNDIINDCKKIYRLTSMWCKIGLLWMFIVPVILALTQSNIGLIIYFAGVTIWYTIGQHIWINSKYFMLFISKIHKNLIPIEIISTIDKSYYSVAEYDSDYGSLITNINYFQKEVTLLINHDGTMHNCYINGHHVIKWLPVRKDERVAHILMYGN